MDLIKTVREALGISQQELARILGVSLSLIKHVETGRRRLPSDARSVLAFMYDLIQNIDPQAKEEAPPVSDIWKDRKLKLVRARLATVELEIEKWETKQKQAESRIKVLEAMRADPLEKISVSQGNFMALLEYDTGLSQDPEKQKPYWDLVLRMEGLKAVLKRLEEI